MLILHICQIQGRIAGPAALMRRSVMPSRLHAFVGDRSRMTFPISSNEISLSSNTGGKCSFVKFPSRKLLLFSGVAVGICAARSGPTFTKKELKSLAMASSSDFDFECGHVEDLLRYGQNFFIVHHISFIFHTN